MESNNKENIDKKILKIVQIIFKKKKIDIKTESLAGFEMSKHRIRLFYKKNSKLSLN